MTLLEETGRNREHKLRPTATTPEFYSTDRNVGPSGFILVAAAKKGDFHRNLDTRTMEFTFRGESCGLPLLAKEAEMLRDAAGNWLKNHDRLHRPC